MSIPPCAGQTKLLDETPEGQQLASPWGSKRAYFVAIRESLECVGPASPRLAPPTDER